MRTTSTCTALLCAGIASVMALSPIVADAATRAGRDAAIEKCVAYAQQNLGIDGHGRTGLYKGCMVQAGFRP
jgi:hypothetical protein